MRKTAQSYSPPGMTIGRWVTCPFCGEPMALNYEMPWCAKCFVEWLVGREDPRTGYDRIVFDDTRKTSRFALAKAFGRAGGVGFGGGRR